MKIETFFANAVKLAAHPATDTVPALELSAGDMKEFKKYLEDNNLPLNVVSDQEISFEIANLKFTAIENDKGDDTGIDGKLIDVPKKDAKLSKEDQAIVDANTDNFEATPLTTSPANENFAARENSEILTPEDEAKESKKKESQSKEDKTKKSIGK